MIVARGNAFPAVRVWIVEFDDWKPASWHDIPPRARVLIPFDDGAYSANEAELLAQGFNQEMLARAARRWAILHPVTIRFEGDLVAGQVWQKAT